MTGFREVRRTAPLIVGLIFVVASAASLTPARASVPSGTPTFSNPLDITNRFHPFEPGGVKVYRGTKGTSTQVVVDLI